jgi:hypothetical protein
MGAYIVPVVITFIIGLGLLMGNVVKGFYDEVDGKLVLADRWSRITAIMKLVIFSLFCIVTVPVFIVWKLVSYIGSAYVESHKTK